MLLKGIINLFVFTVLMITTCKVEAASFTPLGDLFGGVFDSSAQRISADGTTVTGTSQSTGGAEAFIWKSSTGMVGLGELPGGTFDSNGLSISADGSTIVGRSISVFGNEAFRWTAGTGMVGLGDLGGFFFSEARGVSSNGAIVAGRSASPTSSSEAFLWTDGTGMVGQGGDLPGGPISSEPNDLSDDGSTFVGKSTSASGIEAFFWTVSTGTVGIGDLSGGVFLSEAISVSMDGSVVVGHGQSAIGQEAFRYMTQGSILEALGDLPGGNVSSVAFGVSEDGTTIVGRGETATGKAAFIWDENNGMRSIQDLLENQGVDLSGWSLTNARDIAADKRTIIGFGINPSGNTEAWIATLDAVPEPSTILLLGTGLVGLFGYNYRRRTTT